MKEIIENNRSKIHLLEDKFNSLENMLGVFSEKDVDDNMVLKIMQTQEFCRELS